jgi:hypothetical protein
LQIIKLIENLIDWKNRGSLGNEKI